MTGEEKLVVTVGLGLLGFGIIGLVMAQPAAATPTGSSIIPPLAPPVALPAQLTQGQNYALTFQSTMTPAQAALALTSLGFTNVSTVTQALIAGLPQTAGQPTLESANATWNGATGPAPAWPGSTSRDVSAGTTWTSITPGVKVGP